ncbi:MAG: EAL domain-containing protein [Lachnospiraceae bacterium]|nr:EAL domain-containing protein [Lachnospiraceae bacterium]
MKKILFLSLCILLLLAIPAHQARALEAGEEEKTIVVGWYEQDGYMKEDESGKITGFGIDYLNAISQYTDWDYQFVKGSRKQCLTWLESGQIDLLSPISTTLELSNAKTASTVIGDDYGYIYKLSNNFDLCYEHARQMRNVTLGIKRDSGVEENLEQYCEKNNISFYEIVYFDDMEEMLSQLADEKIDAIVTDSFVSLSNLKVIGRFYNGQVTFASSDEAVLTELNDAMEKIKMNNPGFTEDLRELYFAEASNNNLEYSWTERVFLDTDQVYNVALCADQYPICYRLGTDSGYKGIALEVLKKIEYHTGLEFQISYVTSFAEGEELLRNGEVDILGSCVMSNNGLQGISRNLDQGVVEEYTSSFYEIGLAFVGNRDLKMSDALKIAVPEYFSQGLEGIKSQYPQYEFLVYENDMACFDAILSNEADAAIQSDLKVNELSVYEKYKDIQNLKYIPGNFITSFVIHDENGLLLGILNKAINSISESSRVSIINNNIQHISVGQFSFWDFLSQYSEYLIAGVLLLFLLNYGQGYYRKYKIELKNKEIAYRDSVANISSMEKFRLDVTPILQSGERDNYYVLAVDVDKFKVVNDLYGYEQGDRVIAFLARILKQDLGEEDYITRSNADNFVVFKHSNSILDVEKYLKDVFSTVETMLTAQKTHYHLILKAGIYHLEAGDDNLSSTIDKANLAKSSIERSHKSSYRIYEEHMRQQNIFAKYLENEMDDALNTGQFCVYLQPQVDFKTRTVVSAEALVRWKHPRDGMIPPDQFIPIFEKNGFINRLDFYVWEESMKTLARWREQGKHMVPIAINLSRIDVQNDQLVDELRGLMDKYGLESRWIKTELTESICIDGDTLMLKRMQELKQLGLKIAVDDFGSGYSSLHLLKKMPIDILKIDKSFLDFELEMDVRDEIVIRDIVEMGKHLELQIIAEGVETAEQSEFLERIGCDIAQGYYYGKPMPVDQFEVFLAKNH